MLRRYAALAVMLPALMLAALLPTAAYATPFLVSLNDGTNSASFTVSDMPAPTSFVSGNNFALGSVPTLLNGAVVNDDWYFLTSSSGGGIADSLNTFNLVGPQYFSGALSAPTLLPQALTGQSNLVTGQSNVTVYLGPAVMDLQITVAGPSHTASFAATLMPTPGSYVAGNNFALTNVSTILDGVAVTDTWYFLTASSGGGLADSLNIFNLYGPQYWFGTEANPVFQLGTYTGQSNIYTGDSQTTVTIAAAVVAVPEPATIPALCAGLLGLAAARRRRA